MKPRLQRQERAFERSYRKHVGDVYHYALGVLSDPLDAENVTHTTFQNAYRAFRQDEGPRPQLNGLLAIAHDVCRRREEYPGVEEPDLLGGDELLTAADVRRALARLPFDQRAVLVMREVDGRSNAEIADVLGLTTERVETLLFEARQALREELEGSLTCHEAELAISRRLDDRLVRKERRLLRAHVRSCEECEDFAVGQEAQRTAIRALAATPLPETLASFAGLQRRRVGLRVAARITALGGTVALVVALVSAGGVPHPAGFLGQKPGPDADAAVVKKKQLQPKQLKRTKVQRKFLRPAASKK